MYRYLLYLTQKFLSLWFPFHGIFNLSVHNLLKQANKENDEVYTQLTLLPLPEVLLLIMNVLAGYGIHVWFLKILSVWILKELVVVVKKIVILDSIVLLIPDIQYVRGRWVGWDRMHKYVGPYYALQVVSNSIWIN